ncbi:MAG: hypothetical protein L6W00_04685 [Lentisphaeria bacterium]|nr:MAG: hypothetical protein L6W00_04685 [Lentisphaeria bacterium]
MDCEVAAHCPLNRFRIAGGDYGEQVTVGALPGSSNRWANRLDALCTRGFEIGEELEQNPLEGGQGAAARRLIDAGVKAVVAVEKTPVVGRIGLFLPDDLLQVGKILLRELFGEHVGQAEFDRHPQAEEILLLLFVEERRIDHLCDRLEDRRVTDHHSAPLFRFDESHHPQAAERFTDDRAAGLEHIGELFFHRQPITGPETVFPQVMKDLFLGDIGQ